jgi:spore coat polysaccharide biosynthesis protein SpsF (cytidylyltransferase family)
MLRFISTKILLPLKPIDAIIVARTGSTRVPGKALYKISGKPLLQHIIERVKSCKNVGKICMATTDLEVDLSIATIAEDMQIETYRGDAEKVLNRVYQAALHLNSDAIIEIGGDCPFIDPLILDDAIERFRTSDCDYLNNYNPPTFPEGMDVNVLLVTALKTAFHEALAPSHRLHPFSYLPDNPRNFKVENYLNKTDLSSFHWSFDFPEDFEFIQSVYDRLYQVNPVFGMKMILDLIKSDDVVHALNERLRTPPVQHAFWNSPGIIRDLNNDITFLIEQAKQALEEKDYIIAQRCYQQILRSADELNRFTQSKV